LKITLVQGAFLPVPPVLGGAVEKMWYRLCQEFVQAGHEVCYISRRHQGLKNEEVHLGIHHIRVAGYSTPRSIIKLKFLDLLYSFRAAQRVPRDSHVVVTNAFWAPWLLPKSLKKRAYIDVQRMPKGQMWMYKNAGRLRANSTPVAQAIRSELPQAAPSLVRMIPNPLPFDNSGIAVTEKSNALLYCGRIHPEKGLDLLIDAYRQLDTDWPLRLVGPWQVAQGGGGEEYYSQLRVKANGKNVTFVGPIYDIDRLSEEYRAAAIFVYPSVAEKGETFGLAPLEAMAWGCVPIVSSLACFQDFINHDENGVIFDHRSTDAASLLASAMRGLMGANERRQQMSNAAALVRQTHSSDVIAQQFLEDFEQVATCAGK
jgi:glycosyltransferase involved in cell wall biosynthesis